MDRPTLLLDAALGFSLQRILDTGPSSIEHLVNQPSRQWRPSASLVQLNMLPVQPHRQPLSAPASRPSSAPIANRPISAPARAHQRRTPPSVFISRETRSNLTVAFEADSIIASAAAESRGLVQFKQHRSASLLVAAPPSSRARASQLRTSHSASSKLTMRTVALEGLATPSPSASSAGMDATLQGVAGTDSGSYSASTAAAWAANGVLQLKQPQHATPLVAELLRRKSNVRGNVLTQPASAMFLRGKLQSPRRSSILCRPSSVSSIRSLDRTSLSRRRPPSACSTRPSSPFSASSADSDQLEKTAAAVCIQKRVRGRSDRMRLTANGWQTSTCSPMVWRGDGELGDSDHAPSRFGRSDTKSPFATHQLHRQQSSLENRYLAPMVELSSTAPTWWRAPEPHLQQAKAFDSRQKTGRQSASRALDSLEDDITSLSKAYAFRVYRGRLERNRYIVPHVLQKAKVYKAGKVIVKEAPPPPPEKEAWSLEQSIWAPRKKWCDALDFWDTDEVERKKFEWIWQTSRQEQGLDKLIMLHDDAGGVDEDGDGTPDEIEEVGDVLWDLHDLIFCAYDYYCGCGKNIQSMALNQWTDFIEDCKLVDRKSKFCKKADIDRLFITVDSRMGKPSKQLSRIEFLAALVHLGINRYVLPGVVSDVSEALSKLLQEDVEARLPAEIFEEANHFRTHFCYREDVSETLAKHEVSLRRLFMGISASDGGEVGQKHMASLCSFSEWQMFVKLCKLIGPDLTERDAKLSFAWARMAVINGASEQGAVKESNLPFEGFLEACCRLAVLKSLPTDAEIEASSSADAGLHIRHLIATDEVAYNELVASRSSPWPGSFREPKQEPARCVEHIIMMLIRTVQGGPGASGPCGSGSKQEKISNAMELSQADVKLFCKIFANKA